MKRSVALTLALTLALSLAVPLVAVAADLFFVDTVDTPPVIADTQAPGTWYIDRYPPKYFDQQVFDGDNRLRIGISEEDSATGRPPAYSSTFYNTQGRKYDLNNGVDTYIAADLYIGPEWETEQRRSDIWATTFAGSDPSPSGYPILGFISQNPSGPDGFRFFTQDVDQNPGTPDGGWAYLGLPDGFEYGRWYNLRIALTGDAYCVFIDGDLVYRDTFTYGSTTFGNMMLQGYNFGSTYDIYWDNVEAGQVTAPTVDIEKTVDFDGDGVFADSEMAPVGDATWKLSVTNTSKVVLTDVTVDDTTGASYGPLTLGVGETWETTYSTAISADTVSVATVSASAACTTTPATDSDQATATLLKWPSGRIWGENRYSTGTTISDEHFDSADTAVIATGRGFADGLSASGLAGAYDAPVLLTDSLTLSPGVAAELERLGVSHVVVCGQTKAISTAVEQQIDALEGITVERIGGANRYETAKMLADEIVVVTGFTPALVFVSRGDQFPDALSVSPIAWANDLPVLLTPPSALSGYSSAYLSSNEPSAALIVGGTSAVSDAAETALGALVADVQREEGTNRFETAVAVADWAYAEDLANTWFVGVATGMDFPDALAAGAGVGARNGVLVLAQETVAPDATRAFVQAHKPAIATLQVFGGSAVVSEDVLSDLLALAGIVLP